MKSILAAMIVILACGPEVAPEGQQSTSGGSTSGGTTGGGLSLGGGNSTGGGAVSCQTVCQQLNACYQAGVQQCVNSGGSQQLCQGSAWAGCTFPVPSNERSCITQCVPTL